MPLNVAVIGSCHAGDAVLLASCDGLTVTLIVDDDHDFRRFTDLSAANGPLLACDMPIGCDLVLGSGPHVDLVLGWSRGSDFLNLSVGHAGTVLLETNAVQRCAPLVETLDASWCVVPPKHAPFTSRYLATVSAAVEGLLLEGSTPADIDSAVVAAGFACGPFELQDQHGVDTSLALRRAVFAHYGGPVELPLFARAVNEGRLGQKASVGWYRYPGGSGKVADPLVEDMAAEEAYFLGRARRDVTDADCVAVVTKAVKQTRAACLADGAVLAELNRMEQHLFGTVP